MPLYRNALQFLGAIALLAVALACGGKSKGTDPATANTVIVGGSVTYKRVPLAKDAQGVPTGLVDATVAANLQTLPARGMVVRVYQQVEQTQVDGTKTSVWKVVENTQTDTTGTFAVEVPKDLPTMVEVLSSFASGNSQLINLVAEPTGISSPTVAFDRLRYALRKAADGTAPAGVNIPSSILTAPSTLTFTVGLNDEWWVVNPSFRVNNLEAPLLGQAVLETSLPGRTAGLGSGSRVVGIGDTIASFVATYGSAHPGTTLDLHYWPGRTESRGTFIDYDQSLYPQAFDTSTGRFHYFGSISAGPTNDDAWDEGVIFPLLARNFLFAEHVKRTFGTPLNPLLPPSAALTDLSPDMARLEGLVDGMAANLLKSPYQADTQGTSLAAPVKDIRDVSGLTAAQLGPTSAPAVRALSWDVILKANSLANPGIAADWANINVLATTRFFYGPAATNGATDTTARDIEPLNIYTQLTRLKEAKGLGEPVDLATVFTDAVLTALATPYGITWPRPTTGPLAAFVLDWGTDPNSTTTPLAPVAFSMAKAVQVNGVYPNLSQGEVAYAGFSLNADKRYQVTATISPALGAGAELELDLPRMGRTFTFTGAGGSTGTITIPVDTTAPVYHPVRLRLKSPSSIQPDVTVTMAFTPAP
jgi:hypothetical protein